MNPLERLKLDAFPQPEPIMLQHPVLLCHGFGALGNFVSKGLLHSSCMLLRSHGVLAFAPNILPYGRINTRAEAWCEIIDVIKAKTGASKLHVIAHSMGGLDIRYAISRLARHTDILSLTTISTPHQGTSLAKLTLNTPDPIRENVLSIMNWFGNNVYPNIPSDVLGALRQLSPEYVRQEFNPATPNHPEVVYQSVTAACGKGTDIPINKLLIAFNNYIYEREGLNDGYVPTEGARWGTLIAETTLSHAEQIRLNISSKKIPQWRDLWVEIAQSLRKTEPG
ncbi:MAG: hypothetical protein LAT75_03600 [Candidatus Cyclonatronum sp.]|uniref:lipase family alpha/beta hydrolase n=1 Tax=Cyclonatronum sp. TaxID=3024185 RepID=UPI0025BA5957|nr:alpha/beta fold hydrolase [Cyclonatronum sp.]MCH8485922.1 hypothetical protein [Cyclonatronum sp.]